MTFRFPRNLIKCLPNLSALSTRRIIIRCYNKYTDALFAYSEHTNDSVDEKAYIHYNERIAAWLRSDLDIGDTNDRVLRDPDIGRGDGVLYLTLPGAFPTRTKTKAEGFSLFTTPKEIVEEPAHNQEHPATTKQSVVTNIFGTEKIGLFLEEDSGLHRTESSIPDKPPYSGTDRGRISSKSSTKLSSDVPTISKQSLPESSGTDAGRDLHLPLCMIEYKKDVQGGDAGAGNQLRMYLTAAVRFMEQFNVEEFPIFGLVTKGIIGVVTCSWLRKVGDLYVCCSLDHVQNSSN